MKMTEETLCFNKSVFDISFHSNLRCPDFLFLFFENFILFFEKIKTKKNTVRLQPIDRQRNGTL